MPIGWFNNLAEAKTYFTNERLITTAWDNLSTDALKTKAVWNGYNRIFYNPRYDVPTYAAATPAQLVILKKVNGEMAYYLAQHLDDEDRRMGLRAQGVVKAGIAKEDYKENSIELPVPAMVEELLEDFDEEGAAMAMIPIERDEDEDLSTDVVEED